MESCRGTIQPQVHRRKARSRIIPKSDTVTIQKIKAAIEAAYHEGEAKLKGNGKSVPALSVIKNPLRDGDTERPDDPAYAGCYFVNANSTTAPGIVDADRNPILVRSEVYSGVYGRASINFYAFNSNGNRGIACGLNNLQIITILCIGLLSIYALLGVTFLIHSIADIFDNRRRAKREEEREKRDLEYHEMRMKELK